MVNFSSKMKVVGGGGDYMALDKTFWTLCDSQRRSVCYLQAYQGSMNKHTVCFTDLCSQIGIVLQTVAILGWRSPTFSYQFSSQYFIICQLYSYRHLELQDICNALVIMLDKVKITPELWSVIHVLKECELKNQVLFLLTLSDMKTVVQFIVLPLSI